jgi:hypothetical protein
MAWLSSKYDFNRTILPVKGSVGLGVGQSKVSYSQELGEQSLGSREVGEVATSGPLDGIKVLTPSTRSGTPIGMAMLTGHHGDGGVSSI